MPVLTVWNPTFSVKLNPATVHFDSLYLDLPIAASGGTVTTTDATRPLGGRIYDLQPTFGWTSNQYAALSGFTFTETVRD